MQRKYTYESLRAAVEISKSWREVVDEISMHYTSRTIANLRKSADQWKIDYSHFLSGGSFRKLSLEEILVKDSQYPKNCSYRLKQRLWSAGILEPICVLCGISDEWNGQKGTDHLELDHINGHPTDNRIDNLRILCSNCHSWTETNCGKKRNV